MCAVAMLALLVLLTGCATTPEPAGPDGQVVRSLPETQPIWQFWRFQFARADDGSARTYLDYLVADQLLYDAVLAHQDAIQLWRFHRRWPQDPTGHQLTLRVYAPAYVGREISRSLAENPLIATLMDQGYLVRWRIDGPQRSAATDPAATSDLRWSVDVQREWPYFIMGVSRFWAGLVRAEALARSTTDDLHERYRAVEEAMLAYWRNDARHALLHHLNGIFGYAPLEYYDGSLLRF